MTNHWTRVYPEGTPKFDEKVPGPEDALRYKGLLLVPLYDMYSGIEWEGEWELCLERTGDLLMEVRMNSDEEAMALATKVADLAAWETFGGKPAWCGPLISQELRDFIRTNREHLMSPDGGAPYCTLEDLGIGPLDGLQGLRDEDVPFGPL